MAGLEVGKITKGKNCELSGRNKHKFSCVSSVQDCSFRSDSPAWADKPGGQLLIAVIV